MLLLSAVASAEEFNIYLKTSPALGLLRPFADPVSISLLVTHADGRPLEHGSVAIVLDAPKPGAFLSTDFPMVEGSRLLKLVLPLRQGRVSWRYLFPIRGDYHLSVSVTATDGRALTKSFVVPILENRTKWLWLSSFCLGLFLLGFAAGRIFTVIPASATALWLLVFLGAVGSVAGHDGPSTVDNMASESRALQIADPTVGKPTLLRWRAADGIKATSSLSLTITHLEKHQTVFAVDNVPVDNEYQLEFQFPDGAEYRVNSIAQVPGQAPLRTEQLVAVTGIEPPITAQVPSLMLFLGVIVLGLGAGRRSKRFAAR
jgi:hypothetical protein